eukprot:gene11784-5121_t
MLQLHLTKAKREAEKYKVCEKCLKPKIIGISGGTRSGKSTLAKVLIKKPYGGCSAIHFDGFFKNEQNIPVDEKTGFKNWDLPDSLEFEAYIQFVNYQKHLHTVQCENCSENVNSVKKRRIMFLEGFLLYYFDELFQICEKKIFIFVDKETALERRTKTTKTSLEYFEEIVWPSYLKHNDKLKTMGNDEIFYISGKRTIEDVFNRSVDYIEGKKMTSDIKEFLDSFH